MRLSHRKAREAAATLATLAVAALALGGAVAPATAAPAPAPQILLSSDGVAFGTSLNGSIFDGLGKLIPGESITANLWVKNPTAEPADVRVSARDIVASSAVFAENVTMSTWNSSDDATLSTALSDADACDIMVDSQPLAAGATMQMAVTFAMADVGGTIGQNDTASISALVAMRDSTMGPFPESACDDNGVIVGPTDPPTAPTGSTPSTNGLAHTGAEARTPLLVVGGLIAGGLLFFLLGRRRRKADGS